MKSSRGATVRKSNLPEKICAACARPFRWRRKWADVWDEVLYCSERCRRNKKRASTAEASQGET